VACDIPFAGVNHLEGHLWSTVAEGKDLPLPALALLVSGGHTELIRVNGFGRYTFLGGTVDDAAGEAFDKVGGLLGIDYPAGAGVSRLAEQGDPNRFQMPIAQLNNPFDFSFSGLKTAALRSITEIKEKKLTNWEADFAAAFQEAVVVQLAIRLDRALENEEYQSLVLAGGVAANNALRKKATSIAERHGVGLHVPSLEYCTDNGGMIAWLGWKQLKVRGADTLDTPADPNLSLV
ncbi:tRNA (adenosine(37)-N6)-threonylcarbamoyltransferase complex transferase subunit TsaD, partial [bacterium]|nr:tRNA (adenosine(37)-N6)-threonylcarbamoyltransferase complex transferase subunit TsaD [bacterium]